VSLDTVTQVFNLRLKTRYLAGQPVQAESIGALNSHIDKLPDMFLAFAYWPPVWRRRKYDNLVRAGSAH
jgi:hypothetical protein